MNTAMNPQTLGSRIRLLRINNDLSQENIADMIGLTQSAYSKIERGERQMSLFLLEKIATIFNVELTRLIAYCKGTVSLPDMLRDMEETTAK